MYFKHWIDSGRLYTTMYDNDHQRVGSSSLERTHMRTLIIERPYRRKGYGSILLKEMVDICKKSGYSFVEVLAYPSEPNIMSVNTVKEFYRKNGFVDNRRFGASNYMGIFFSKK